jgi:hypothetical protein
MRTCSRPHEDQFSLRAGFHKDSFKGFASFTFQAEGR